MSRNFKELYQPKGIIKSIDDDRDYTIDKLIKTAVRLPESYINEVPLTILDQGTVGCCVGCAAAQAKHIIEYKQSGDTEMFSPMYIYANRREDDYHGSGLMPRESLSNMKEFGMCHYKYFPNYYEYEKANKLYMKDKTFLDSKAYPYRLSSYYRLNTINDIKTAIYTMGFAFISYDVYESLYYPDKDGIVQYDKNDSDILGGHQMLAVHFDDKKGCFGICNSWGEDFGIGISKSSNGGEFWIPYDYKPSECWSMVDEITEKEIASQY